MRFDGPIGEPTKPNAMSRTHVKGANVSSA